MLKANELRIGNMILICEEEVEVTAISEDEIGTTAYFDPVYFRGTNDGEPAQCSGIPLTEECLEKFGFREVASKSGTFSKQINPRYDFIIVEMANGYTIEHLWHSAGIQFVHQLQNLYFALTGGELENKQPC